MGNRNGINIAIDIFSAAITLMIGTYLISRRNKAKENQYFIWICILNFVFILGDLSDWCCNGLGRPWYPVVLHIGQFVYYTVTALLLMVFMQYVVEYLSGYEGMPKRNVKSYHSYKNIAMIIAVLHLTGCFLTPFTGLYYVITDENIYMRGDYVLLASILPVVVYVLIMIMVFRSCSFLRMRVTIAILSFVVFPLIGQIIQNFFRGVATLNPAITLAILFIFFNIQLDRDIQHERDKQALSEANIRLLMSQIQPHFIYNTLATIRSLCASDSVRAQEAINDFAVFLRANMDFITNDRGISFEQELNHVKSYLNLEQQMFGDELQVEYDIQVMDFLVPALSLQPIVENAVQKGVRKKEGGGTIVIRTEETEKDCRITVMDDGVGFDMDILGENGHIGIKNVQRRLNALCGGTLTIESVTGKGTTVLVVIPKGGKQNEISFG